MSFDWKTAEQGDKERSDRRLLPSGITFTALGIISGAVRLAVSGDPWEMWSSGAFTLIGIAYLIAWWRKKP